MKSEKIKIVVAHGHSSLEVCHSLTPLILLADESDEFNFKFVDYKFFSLNKLRGDILILVRKFHKLDIRERSNISLMIDELQAYKRNFSKVIYFDDSAAVSHILFYVVPYLDGYWVRGLLSNVQLYSKPFYGGRTYSQFYHDKYGIIDENEYQSPYSVGNLSQKIKIAWNIGIGLYPSPKSIFWAKNYTQIKKILCIMSPLPSIKFVSFIVKKFKSQMIQSLSEPVDLSKKKALISSRFSSKGYYNSISFHRKLLLEKIKDKEIFIKGLLTHKKYIEECNSVSGILSPFGWGEICYRDYEAVMCGNALVKPDMSHIETWPNIYTDDCYLKLDWDFNNLDKIVDLFFQEEIILKCIEKSRKKYLKAIKESSSRAEMLIKDHM
ncbi:hypothetical protein B0W81_02335 [Prochlorococcus sp. HOT_208_60]|nr:hypothetical protein B0W81_02335 [Prochlorococcus sp. HOT_208_60]